MSLSQGSQWRQGHVLQHNSFLKLGLSEPTDIDLALVISHDCDIIKDYNKEPVVEFIIGKRIQETDGNYTFGKNPRILHLPVVYRESINIIELDARQKFFISKEFLLEHDPDTQFLIELKSLDILQSWLAARYRRAAFPNMLIDRLTPILEFLEKEGKKMAHEIVGYWFEVDPREEELPQGQPYELRLSIIYTIDSKLAEKKVKDLVNKIKEKFCLLMEKTSHLGPVILLNCTAFSEQEFTLYDLRTKTQYKFEYLSHKIEPTGPIVTV